MMSRNVTASPSRTEQRDALFALLRAAPLDLARDPGEQRTIFAGMLQAAPVPDGTRLQSGELGGVPVVWADPVATSRGVVMYFHGGAYVAGDARSAIGTPATLAEAAGMRAVSVEYRLAPEHPFPAAIDDALAAYRGLLATGADAGQVVIAGDSAGGGLALALLIAARDAGLPLPAAGVVFSPWTDLTVSGSSVVGRRDADPTLTPEVLRICAQRYLGGAAATDPLASPLHADLRGLPPLLIAVGSHEILLDDALRLAVRAAEADVTVDLEVARGLSHVYPTFYPILDEGRDALERAARFVDRFLQL